jgi:hypothetical protein
LRPAPSRLPPQVFTLSITIYFSKFLT